MRNKVFIALVVVAVIINLFSFKAGHAWGDDFAGFVKQSQTFKNGDFSTLKKHIANTDYILNYPWGYPILLSPLINFFDRNINILKYYTYIFFILSLIFIFLLLKKDREFAILTILFISCNPFFWEFKNNILADFPNLCFTFLSLYLIDRIVIKKQIIVNEYLSNFCIGLSVFICFSMRNQSLILLPSLFILQIIIFKKSVFKFSLVKQLVIPYITFFVFAYIFSLAIPVKSTSYLEQYNFNFSFVFKTIQHNIVYYFKVWDELFVSIAVISYFSKIFSVIAICFALIGVAISLKKEYALIIFFPLVCICLFLITPFYQGLRYIIPIVPLFFYFFIKGAYYFFITFNKKYGLYIYSFFTVFLITASFKTIAANAYYNYKVAPVMQGPFDKDSKEMFAYIKESTAPDNIIEFWKPRAMLLFAGRDAIFTPDMQDYFDREPDYLVYYKYPYEGDDGQIPLDTLYKHNDKLSVVFSNHSFIIFKDTNN